MKKTPYNMTGRAVIAVFWTLIFAVSSADVAARNTAVYKSFREAGHSAFRKNDLSSAENHYQQAVAEAERFGKPSEELAQSLVELGALHQYRRQFKEAELIYERALVTQTTVFGTNKLDSLETLVNLGDVRQWAGNFEGARHAYQRAQTVISRKYNAKHPWMVLALIGQGRACAAMNRPQEAAELFDKAAVLAEAQDPGDRSRLGPIRSQAKSWFFRRVRPGDLPWWVDIAANIGDFYLRQKRYADAEVQFRRMLKLAETYGSKTSEDTVAALARLGEVLASQKRYDEAEPILERAADTAFRGGEFFHFENAIALHLLVTMYVEQNRHEDANECVKRLLSKEILKRKSSFELENLGLGVIAVSYALMGEPAKGEHLLVTALKVKEQVWGMLDPEVVPVLHQTAIYYITQKRLLPAEEALQRAVQVLKVAKVPPLMDSMLVLAAYGELKMLQQDPAAAVSYYEQAYSIAESALGEAHSTLLPLIEKMISINVELKRPDRNEPLHQRVIAIKEKEAGREAMETADAIMRLGENFLALNKYAEAEKYLVRVYTMETKARGSDSMLLLKPIAKLLEVYTALGKDAEQETLLKHQVLIFEKLYGPKHAVLKKPLADCSAVLRKLKRDAEAEQLEARIKGLDQAK